jgi:hypothetical protein
LRKDKGHVTKDKVDMECMAHQFFQELYSADGGVNPTDILEAFETRITEEVNENLCKEFLDDEISDTLFQIGPLKAGLDGFPARFFQKNWDTVKPDIIRGVKKSLKSGTCIQV